MQPDRLRVSAGSGHHDRPRHTFAVVRSTQSLAAIVGFAALAGARPTAPLPSAAPAARLGAACVAATAARPALYQIPLLADQGMAGSGMATLVPAPSPFGITVTPDGHPIFTVTVTVQNLTPLQAGTQYVAWATTQDLVDADKIGILGKDDKAVGSVSWNKYIVLVTTESGTVGPHWKGPVILRGFSPATYLANYASHPLFLGGMPPC
jgi:hypothetical protein